MISELQLYGEALGDEGRTHQERGEKVREKEIEEETEGKERGSGFRLVQGLTTSLFRPAVYQLQTKGLKVYAPLNKFAAISRLPTPSVLVPATSRPCSLLLPSHRATFDAAQRANRKFRDQEEFAMPDPL